MLHKKRFTPKDSYTRSPLHHKLVMPEELYTRSLDTIRVLHCQDLLLNTRNQSLLHHQYILIRLDPKPRPSTPPILLHQKPLHLTSFITQPCTPKHKKTMHSQRHHVTSCKTQGYTDPAPTVREASPHTTPATKSKSPTLPNRKPYWESAEYHSTMIRAWTPNVPLKVKLQHRQILHLLQKVALCRHQISVTLSFCYFFFLWHVLSNWHEIFVIRRLLHQASSSNSWGACFFFVGKKHLFGDFTHPLRPWCLLSGLVKTSDFQPWGHTNVTRFSESRLWQLGTQRIPSRDPWILKCIFTYTTLLRHTSSNASNQWWGV